MVDSYWEGLDVPTDEQRLKADYGWTPNSDTPDHTRHWQNIKSKSYKRCQLDSKHEGGQPPDTAGWKFIECEKINAHFYRNFITLGDDIMLDALADNSYEVVGFQRDHAKADFSDPKSYNWGTVIKDFKPVAVGFREAAVKEQQDAIKEID